MLRQAFRVARVAAIWFVAGCVTAVAVSAGTVVTTTVTTYQYNDDGAPTAIATQVGSAAATVEYLTWDNFVPDLDDPTTGTVTAANGNLSGSGSAPEAATILFTFDRRDRLLAYASQGSSVAYVYYPDGMLESASVDGDGWLLYYDGASVRHAANVRQQSSGIYSAWLGELRLLSDGDAQALVTPRKDVAAGYDPAQDSLSLYRYDAYGADASASTATAYDVAENPFRYAGEMRDPISGAYYLRARWYLPDLPGFASRDPLAQLNRYGYGDGNPVMNVDPSGMHAKSLLGELDDDLREGLDWIDGGVQGHVARLFLAPVLGSLEIIANPKSFWESLKTNYEGSDIYFALGVAGQIATGGLFPIGAEATALIGSAETGLSITQTVTTSIHHRTLDAKDLLESSEELAGNLAYEKGFEKLRASREANASSAREATLDPASRAARFLNEAREASDLVRISIRHRVRLDRTKQARAALRATVSPPVSPDTVRRIRRASPRGSSADPLLSPTGDAWGLVTLHMQRTAPRSAEGDAVDRDAVGPPLRNDCRDSIGDILHLLRGS